MANDLLNKPTEYDSDDGENTDAAPGPSTPRDAADQSLEVDNFSGEDTPQVADKTADDLASAPGRRPITDNSAYRPRNSASGSEPRVHSRRQRNRPHDDSGEVSSDQIGESETSPEPKEASKSDLKDAEENAATPELSEGESPDNNERSFYNPGKPKSKKGRFSNQQKWIAGGGLVGVIISVTLAVLSFVSGPGMLIHFSEFLHDTHMSDQEDAGNFRVMKLAKFALYVKKPELMRLGVLGNAYAFKIESNLKKSGIVPDYAPRTGTGNGFYVDPAAITEESPLARFRNASPEELQSFFESNYKLKKVDMEIIDGKLHLKSQSFGYFAQKKLVRAILQSAGYVDVIPTGRARIMTKKTGSTLSPIRKIDNWLIDKADAAYLRWRDQFNDRIRNGVQETKADAVGKKEDGSDEKAKSKNDTNQAAADDANDTVKQAQQEVGEAAGDAGEQAGKEALPLRQKLNSAAKGAAAIGIFCAIKTVANSVDEFQYTNVILPEIHLAMEMIAVGNQIRSGRNVDLTQLQFYANQLVEHKKNDVISKFTDAKTFRAAMSASTKDSVEVRPELVPSDDGNIVTQIYEKVPGADAACEAVSSPAGIVVSTALDIATGPLAAAGGFIFSQAVGPLLLDGTIRYLAGDQVNIKHLKGADFANASMYGSLAAANESASAAGGVILTKAQKSELELARKEYKEDEFKSRSIGYKLFAYDDSKSLLGSVVDDFHPSGTTITTNLASALASIPRALSGVASTLFFRKADAAFTSTTYDYKLPKIGFSREDLEDQRFDNPYENANEVKAILRTGRGDDLRERAKKCFGVGINKDGDMDYQAPSPKYKTLEDSGTNCGDRSLDWLRLRFYIFDTQLMQSTACYEGDGQSCTEIGFPAADGVNN